MTIETPTYSQNDIPALLHEALPLPQELCQNTRTSLEKSQILQFLPYFISVWEESLHQTSPMDQHVRELLQEYQHKNEEKFGSVEAKTAGDGDVAINVVEKYEKSHPAHGDKMFHSFLTRIQQNPGQILRCAWFIRSLINV